MKKMKSAWLATLIVSAVTVSGAWAATSREANRCPSTSTPSSVAYHCYAAYPEAFYATGYAGSMYRLSWKVTCRGRSVSGHKDDDGLIGVVVDQFTQQAAYKLMIRSDICKIDVAATRIAGDGTIHLQLFINVNHPLPVHN